ncbi:MAG: hypothetical protein MJA83_00110, partial [Gammaproteobacteria bacterium]|nr:hypothetical protein [Gammaproteobacteria bacterium]
MIFPTAKRKYGYLYLKKYHAPLSDFIKMPANKINVKIALLISAAIILLSLAIKFAPIFRHYELGRSRAEILIEFYGIVIDEKSRPLPDAIIAYQLGGDAF